VAGGFKSKFGGPQETSGWFFDSATQYGFVAKFAGGTRLASTALLGGEQLIIVPCPANAQCYSTQPLTSVSALAVDVAGIVTAAGTTNVADFPVTAGAYQTTCQCQNEAPNAFVARINAQESGLVWLALLGATTPESGGFGMSVSGIALDSTGNVVVSGIAAAPNFPVTAGVVGPAFAASPAAFSGYVSKLDSTGARLLFSTFYGGAKVSQVSAPRLDAHGNIWLTAQVIDRSGLALGKDSLVLGSAINRSLVAALSPDGRSVAFSEVLPNGAAGQDLIVNSDSTITVAGPSRVAASLTAIAQGLVLRHPQPGPSGIALLGIADSARNTVANTIAPGEYLSIYGTGLGPAGAQVAFDGMPGEVLYQSANQVNVLLPYEVAGRAQVQIQLTTAAATSQILPLHIVPAQPSVFGLSRQGSNLSIFVSGAGVAQPIQVIFSYTIFVPRTISIQEITVTPSYAGPVDGAPPNLTRIDFAAPSVPLSASDFQFVVTAGSARSPVVPLTIGN
jgi:uncharacterized protein (TIGR03437 family)